MTLSESQKERLITNIDRLAAFRRIEGLSQSHVGMRMGYDGNNARQIVWQIENMPYKRKRKTVLDYVDALLTATGEIRQARVKKGQEATEVCEAVRSLLR